MKKAIVSMSLVLAFSSTALATEIPTDVTVQNLNGTQQYIQSYSVAPDQDPYELISDSFDYEGYTYTYATIIKEELRTEDAVEQTEVVVVESDSKDLEDVLALLSPTIDYESNGYAGTLSLDHTSIVTEAAGYTSKSYTVSETKEIGSLPTNDMSYVPSTTIKDGKTLSLAGVTWQVQATSLVGDALVPSQYMAVATYTAKSSYSAATGYLTTATYEGEVIRDQVDSITYTITYVGEEVSPEPSDESTLGQTVLNTLQNPFVIGGIIAVILVAALAVFLLRRRNLRLAEEQELTDEESEDEVHES